MNVAVIGNGGREHAIAWKLSQSSKIDKIYCIPGNGGTATEKKCENVNINDIEGIVGFVKKNNIELTVVGPEKYLVDGIVDEFKKNNLKIVGPDKKASKLEGSKIYAKNFAKKYGIQTADYQDFNNIEEAKKYIKNAEYPLVIKADGLAAGKGVMIVQNLEEAKKILYDFMEKDVFSGAGKRIIIEKYLEGYEMSIFVLFDGYNYKIFQTAMDHKKIYDGEKGYNTGGMGAVSPHPRYMDGLIKKIENKIVIPTISGIIKEKLDYKGIIFIGLMIVDEEPYLLEYNIRFGDPETQAMLPLLESDLLEIFEQIVNERLDETVIKWKDEYSCCVVATSEGYPLNYEKGKEIRINTQSRVFHAGTKLENGRLLTNGGRVLSVVETGKTYKEAREKAYKSIKNVKFDKMYYRQDIGKGW